jgi:hypothetical protein
LVYKLFESVAQSSCFRKQLINLCHILSVVTLTWEFSCALYFLYTQLFLVFPAL